MRYVERKGRAIGADSPLASTEEKEKKNCLRRNRFSVNSLREGRCSRCYPRFCGGLRTPLVCPSAVAVAREQNNIPASTHRYRAKIVMSTGKEFSENCKSEHPRAWNISLEPTHGALETTIVKSTGKSKGNCRLY